MNTYIQDKLDELLPIQIDILYNEDGQEIVKRQAIVNLFTDYHNHIVEKIKLINLYELGDNPIEVRKVWRLGQEAAVEQVLSLLQDTNPKE